MAGQVRDNQACDISHTTIMPVAGTTRCTPSTAAGAECGSFDPTTPEGVRVGWQNELRLLDEELTAGRVSAEEYRERRDELRRQAESGGQQQASTGGDPFPPPFRWDDDAPTARMSREGSEQTEQAGQAGAADDADATQVVPTEQAAGGEDADPDRTQVVSGAPGHSSGRSQGQQSPVHETPKAASLWHDYDLPATTDLTPVWLKQGPEVFEPDASTPIRVLAAIGMVVLVVGIAVGAYFAFRSGNDPGQPADPATGQTTTTPTAASLIAELPGQQADMSKVRTFDDVKGVGYLTQGEADAYMAGGAGDATMAISTEDGARIIVLVSRQRDSGSAKSARDALAELQLAFKLTELDGPPGVRSAGSDQASAGPLRRAHYASGRYTVRVQVQGPELAAAQRLFSDVLQAQLKRLPADTDA